MAVKKKRGRPAKRKAPAKRKSPKKVATRTKYRTKTVTKYKTRKPKALTGKDLAIRTVAGVGAGVVTAAIAAQLPNTVDPRIKAAVPMGIGAALALSKAGKKKPIIQAAGIGAALIGAVAMTRQVAPQIPLLAGEDDMYDSSDVRMDAALLGAPMAGTMAGTMGAPMAGNWSNW